MYLGKMFNLKRRKMNTRNALLVVAGLMLAWAGVASAELAMTWAVKAGTGVTWTGEAKDESKNYGKGEDWFGKTGGEGFGIWTRTTDESLLANHTIADNGGFRLQAGSDDGETIVMRDLNTDVGLTEGTFNVTSWGTADEPGDFAGYAIYGNVDGSSKELFRWGGQTGVCRGLGRSGPRICIQHRGEPKLSFDFGWIFNV